MVDESAINGILSNEAFRHMGAPRVRLIVEAYERLFAGKDVRFGGWANPAMRKELWRLLGSHMSQISETKAWMVIRRYRDLKRLTVFQAAEAEAARIAAEAKAKQAAAMKVRREAAAKAAAEKAAAAGDAPQEAAAPPAKKAEDESS